MTYKLIDPSLVGEQGPLRTEENLNYFLLTLLIGDISLTGLVVVGPDGGEEPALDFIERSQENFFSPEHDQRAALEDLLNAWRTGTEVDSAVACQKKLLQWWPNLADPLARYAKAMDRTD